MMKKLPLVRIEWGDAWACSRWAVDKELYTDPQAVTDVGYLLKEGKRGVLLVNYFDGWNFGGLHFIPRAMITKTKIIKGEWLEYDTDGRTTKDSR